jgi:hypothetical protein
MRELKISDEEPRTWGRLSSTKAKTKAKTNSKIKDQDKRQAGGDARPTRSSDYFRVKRASTRAVTVIFCGLKPSVGAGAASAFMVIMRSVTIARMG